MAITVMLVDDHRLIIEGLSVLIQESPGLQLLADANDGREAIKLAAQLQPDVVVMDVLMPGLNGVEATRKICARHSGTRVVALSMNRQIQFVQRMLEAGATGYVLKESAFSDLAKAIRAVANGRIYLSAELTSEVLKDFVQDLRHHKKYTERKLSPRETEVLQMVAEGKSSQEIAEILNVSLKTIETHRRQISEKLHLHGVAELTKYAVREGLTTL